MEIVIGIAALIALFLLGKRTMTVVDQGTADSWLRWYYSKLHVYGKWGNGKPTDINYTHSDCAVATVKLDTGYSALIEFEWGFIKLHRDTQRTVVEQLLKKHDIQGHVTDLKVGTHKGRHFG